jgi:uncharacterized protein DUF6259
VRPWLLGTAIAAACLLVAGGAAGGLGAKPKPKPKKKPKPALPATRLNTKDPSVLVLTAPGYRLTLTKANGEIIDLLDRRNGVHVLKGQNGCMWSAKQTIGVVSNGCGFGPSDDAKFTYRWSQATTTLTLDYAGRAAGPGVDARVTIVARPSAFDLRLDLESNVEYPLSAVLFPADLLGNANRVDAGYTPTFLPGVRLSKGFFGGPHRNVETYPSRWAFADFLAADFGPSHLAMYSVNPSPSPIAPVDLGFVRNAVPAACSEAVFCATHVFQTWIARGDDWRSPTVRIRVGGTIEDSLLAYREDNGIDRYPSAAAKLGTRFDTLAKAPLIKADLWKGLPRLGEWAPELADLPRPALVHPVAFQEGGFDEAYPDFLPPDPLWGTVADFNGMIDAAHALGQLVMPYLNASWWDTQGPSVHDLPPSMEPRDIAVLARNGTPATEKFGDKDGYIVSPAVGVVRSRINRLFDEWRTTVPADCMFFDQLGARPWRRDFNPASPTPLAYYDGWLSLFAPYRDRCVMAEDGWDRLAESFAGFHGGVLLMARQFDWPGNRWGDDNWEPYPIATFLFHDKVLMYQHDLYEETMTIDPEVLTFNLAFGLIGSFSWEEPDYLTSPWLGLVGSVQRTLGPLYAGRRLLDYRDVSPGVTRSLFEGGLAVTANWSAAPVTVDGRTIAPRGFVAQTANGSVLAATLGGTWSGVTFPGGAR